jgi:hypothetical protein
MRRETQARDTQARILRLVLAVWAGIVLVICARVLLSPRANSVYPIFAEAGRRWLAGEGLYPEPGGPLNLDRFRYSPLVAALFAPLGLLPNGVGGCLWRLLNAAVYLGAFTWWCRAVLPGGWTLSAGRAAALWLLLVPLSVGSLNNGQSNPLVAGLLLAAVAGVAHRRWNLAAACVAGACLFKGYPLAVGLLLAAVYPRRFAPRLGLTLAVGLALPLVLQRPAFVLGQYGEWLQALGADDRAAVPVSNCYRDLWMLCRMARVPLTREGYLVLQLATGAGAALLCVAGRRAGWSRRVLLTGLLSLGTCWMILCGPATESSTYILLAPVLAWAVLTAWEGAGPGWGRGLVYASLGLLLVGQIACWFPLGKQLHALGIQPLAALLLAVALVARSCGLLGGQRRRFVVTRFSGSESLQTRFSGSLHTRPQRVEDHRVTER